MNRPEPALPASREGLPTARRVAARGRVEVPAAQLLLPAFGDPGSTSPGSGLAHAERLAFRNHDDCVVQESSRLTAVVCSGSGTCPMLGADAVLAAVAPRVQATVETLGKR